MPRYNVLGEPCGFEGGSEAVERKYFWPFFHEGSKAWMIVVKVLLGIVLVPLRIVLLFLGFAVLTLLLKLLDLTKKPGAHVTGVRKFVQMKIAVIFNRYFLFVIGVFWIHTKGRPRLLPALSLSELLQRRRQKHEANSSTAQDSQSQQQTGAQTEDSRVSEGERKTVSVRMSRAALRKLNPAFVINHTSPLDIPLSVYAGGGTFVSKVEVTQIPMLSQVMRSYEMIVVDRRDVHSREQTAHAIEEAMADRSRLPLVVYPEACTTNGKGLISFRPGVFRPGKPVQPVALRYWAPFGSVAWDVQPGLPYFLGFLARPFIVVHITYLPLYEPSAEEQADPVLYATHVRDALAAELGVPTSELNYQQKAVYEEYCRRGTPLRELADRLGPELGPAVRDALDRE